MRKPRIASELIAAKLAERSVEDSERGDASTEFVMVGALLVLLTMAILQVSFALYARTMLVDAAAAGARYGTKAYAMVTVQARLPLLPSFMGGGVIPVSSHATSWGSGHADS